MVMRNTNCWLASGIAFVVSAGASAQQAGSIRGVVYDKDYDAPLALAQVLVVETGQRVTTTDQGTFVITDVRPGTYTLAFTKAGYERQVKTEVVVNAGGLTDVNSSLAGEFTEMEEFVVQDVQIGGGEAALLKLRFESPSLLDSISADLMSKAGASDAGAALNLVAGATVQDGKYAVIRGLPDRYVSSQLNGARLPTADEDKRAVELDQFPAAVIDSIQVSKTFTPDQQGDASGGAVNVVLKEIPKETSFQFKAQVGYNSQVRRRKDFLTYDGSGFDFFGGDDGRRDQQLDKLGENWDGAAGVGLGDAPTDSKWALSGGGSYDLTDDVRIGGFASIFYERDSAYFDNGVNDSYWVTTPGNGLTPETLQGTPTDGDFKTRLLDVTQGSESVQWGGLGTLGIESENHKLGVTFLATTSAEDKATLAENTRGKAYYFPGYDPNDPTAEGNTPENLKASPYTRLETLEYTERKTQSLILNGKHSLAFDALGFDDEGIIRAPIFDWTVSKSSANLDQPDKRQFASLWLPESFNPGFPPFLPPFTSPAEYFPFKPDANFTLGNFQRIWKTIDEESEQYALNLKIPFAQWTDDIGYVKFGYFRDDVDRSFNQDTFSNFNDNSSSPGEWEPHPITDGPPFVDVDYEGKQRITAWYAMGDLPLINGLNLIGGARFESTSIGVENFAEADSMWFPPGAVTGVALSPGAADVDFAQDDVLPSIGLVYKPIEQVTLRTSYSQTVARQTFKELTPIIQQEFLGGPIFIGNPNLQMSSLQNYDFRVDYTPFEGGLISASLFHKDVDGPIEYVQRVAEFNFTSPTNYPKGKLTGLEFEVRQNMGDVWEALEGLTLGGNATFIESEVTLPDDEAADFNNANIAAPMATREMTGTPEYLYNLYATLDVKETGTQLGLFYTVIGDALIAGAGTSDSNFVPSIFSTTYGTLNFTITQSIGEHFKIFFQAKNLTNPDIETVYRSPYTGGDVLNTRYSQGIDFAVGASLQFTF